jgi:hypothetical protein
MTLFERVHMHSFAGATEWLNSEPLGPAELRGRVVLVNFWTLTRGIRRRDCERELARRRPERPCRPRRD